MKFSSSKYWVPNEEYPPSRFSKHQRMNKHIPPFTAPLQTNSPLRTSKKVQFLYKIQKVLRSTRNNVILEKTLNPCLIRATRLRRACSLYSLHQYRNRLSFVCVVLEISQQLASLYLHSSIRYWAFSEPFGAPSHGNTNPSHDLHAEESYCPTHVSVLKHKE